MISGVGRIRDRLLPPKSGDRVEGLQWTRRMAGRAAVIFLLLGILQLVIGQKVLAVVFLVGALGNAYSFVSLGRTIDRVASAPPPTEDQRERGLKRARRLVLIGAPTMVAVGAGIGWLLDGLPAAIFMGTFMSIGMGTGLWLSRHQLRG
jgi:hypothetical protein